MEGYAWVSNSANRKLTRKRPFRNLEKAFGKISYSQDKVVDAAFEKRMAAVERRTKRHSMITIGIFLVGMILLFAWVLSCVFL